MPLLNSSVIIKSSVDEVLLDNLILGETLDYVEGDKFEVTYTGTGRADDFGVYWATGLADDGDIFGVAVGVAGVGRVILNTPAPKELSFFGFTLLSYGWDKQQERDDAIGNQIIELPSFTGDDRDYHFFLNLNEVPPPPPPLPPVTGYPAGASEYDPDAVMPYEDSGTTTYEEVVLPDTDLTINPVQKLDTTWKAILLTAGAPASATVKFGDEPIGITTSGKKFDGDLAYGFYVLSKLYKLNGKIETLPGQIVKYNDRAEIAIEQDTVRIEVQLQFYGWKSDFDLNFDRQNNSLSRVRTVGSAPLIYKVNTQYDRSTPGGDFSDPKLINFSVNADVNFSLGSGLFLGADFDVSVPIMKDMGKFINDFDGFANSIESNSQTALNTVMGISGNSCPLLNSLGNLLDGALGELAEAAEAAIPNVMQGINDIVENVRRMIPEMQGFIGDAFRPVRNLMQPIYNALNTAMIELQSRWQAWQDQLAIVDAISESLQSVLDSVPDILDDAYAAWQNLRDSLVDDLSDATDLAEDLKDLFDILKGEVLDVISVISPVVSTINSAFGAVTQQIANISQQVATALGQAVSQLENAFTGITGVLDEALVSLNAATCGAVNAVIGVLSTDVASKINAVQNFADQGLGDILRNPAQSVMGGMRDVAETQLASMTTRAQGVVNDVTGDINNYINDSQNIIDVGIDVDLNFSL